MPVTLPLLGGAVTDWLVSTVGVRVVDALLPSVRFALESAVLRALVASPGGRSGETAPPRPVALADALEKGASNAAAEVRDEPGLETTSRRAVEINALIAACEGDTPASAAAEAAALVKRGYRCLKIKVARGAGAAGAAADADRVEAIRAAVGPETRLRCDANRGWSLNDALVFGLRVMNFDLQYVEEPVRDVENDLAAFHCTTGVPVALDESVDDAFARADAERIPVADALEELFEPTFGVVALVLKPGVLGGFEACAAAAAAARTKGVDAVVTTAFESGVGVSACAHLAAALDAASERAARDARRESRSRDRSGEDDGVVVSESASSARDDDALSDAVDAVPVASRLGSMQHGLGTGAWLAGDVTATPSAPLVATTGPNGVRAGVGVALETDGDAANGPFDASVVTPEKRVAGTASWGSIAFHEVVAAAGTYRFRVRDSLRGADAGAGDGETPSVLFLHGFMGGAEDWDAVARGLCAEARCVAADMPGHGGTTFVPGAGYAEADGYTVEAMAEATTKLGDALFGGGDDAAAPVTVVGYSMGARVALAAAAARAGDSDRAPAPSFPREKRGWGVVSIGGSPGIAGDDARRARAARDDALADALRAAGTASFARAWYQQGLFRSLTAHPRFSVARLAALRARGADASDAAERLAATLSAASPGRQARVDARALVESGVRVDFVTGALDAKFVKVAETLAGEMRAFARASGREARVAESVVPSAGHAAHLEAPETLVLRLLRVVRAGE